ncbi:MAG: substrate-binding domain-containing protein [Myxococcaceae bacterium]
MSRHSPRLECRVREAREASRMSQQALAAAVGISRQALSALESGRSIPGTDVALELSRVLGRPVDRLFTSPPAPRLMIATACGDVTRGARVLLAKGSRGWLARPLESKSAESLQPADAVVTRQLDARQVEVELLREPAAAAERLVVMGCAPALGLLSSRLASSAQPVDLAWVNGTSTAALEALEAREVQLAGIHLRDARTGRFNLPAVERRFARKKMMVVTFAAWEQGLVVAPGNPLKLRAVSDLARVRVRLVGREPGAGATKLLAQLAPKLQLEPVMIARGHLEVAQAVAQGAADVGIAIGGAALAYGLDFVPLVAERFDLVFHQPLSADRRIERLIDELSSPSFRRELDALGGYDAQHSGEVLEL